VQTHLVGPYVLKDKIILYYFNGDSYDIINIVCLSDYLKGN